MASLTLSAATTVAALKSEFNSAFGATLRVYNGGRVADDSATLGELGLSADGSFECRSSLTVDSFIERMKTEYNLNVKVYTCDGWVAVLGGLTLESAGKVKKNAVKADMESMKAYQRTEKSKSEVVDGVPTSAQIRKTDFEFIADGYTFYVDSDGEVWIIGGPQRGGSVVVPESVCFEGIEYTITKIGVDLENASFVENDDEDFDEDIDIDDEEDEEIEIGDDEEGNEEDNGFYNNSSVTSIEFPKTLNFLGAEAIMACPQLMLVGIGKGIKKIDTNAISECASLERIIIFTGKDDVCISKNAFKNNGNDTKVVFVNSRLLTIVLNLCTIVLCALGVFFSFPFMFLGFIKPVGRGISSFIRNCVSKINDRFGSTLDIISLTGRNIWVKSLLKIVSISLILLAEFMSWYALICICIPGAFYAVLFRFLRNPVFNSTRALYDTCATLFNRISEIIAFDSDTPIVLKIGSVVLQLFRHVLAAGFLLLCWLYMVAIFLYPLIFKCLREPYKNAVSLLWKRSLQHIKAIFTLIIFKQPSPIRIEPEIDDDIEKEEDDEMDFRPRKKDGTLDMRYSVNKDE